MGKRQRMIYTYMMILLFSMLLPITSYGEEAEPASEHEERQTNIKLLDTEQSMKRFTFDSGYDFEYPDAVRGIYVTGNSAGGSRFESLVDLVDTTALNAMVI